MLAHQNSHIFFVTSHN